MGLKDYYSRNPVGLAIPHSAYDEVVASINAFINNLEIIDNFIPSNLAKSEQSIVSADQKARGKQKVNN